MSKKTDQRKEQEFVKLFINAIYGILLGYGFGSAILKIYVKTKDPNTLLYCSFVNFPFEYLLVLFAIIILCVHWWDWRLAVSTYVTKSIVEFTINILILINIEWLFFEYDSFLNFSFLMATLGFINFIWVVNFRYNRYVDSKLSFVEFFSKKVVVSHIFKRFLGFVIYTTLFVLFMLDNLQFNEWVKLIVLASAFWFDRKVLYKNRKILKHGIIEVDI